jgi:hypothetical protein
VTRLAYTALAAALLGAAVGRLAWGWAFAAPERRGVTIVYRAWPVGVGVRWGAVDRPETDAGAGR